MLSISLNEALELRESNASANSLKPFVFHPSFVFY